MTAIANVNLVVLCNAMIPKLHATAVERAVDSACLGATEDNTQGGHESLNLNTKRCCT